MAVEKTLKQAPGSGEDIARKSESFLRGVWTELEKTTWPSPHEVQRLSTVVIGIIVALGIYMAILNSALEVIFNWITRI